MEIFHFPLVLLSLILFSINSVQSWYYSNGGKIAWDFLCDFLLFDIEITPSSTGENCADLCLANFECTHFSWSYQNDNLCYIKKITDPDVVPNYPPENVDSRCGFVVTDVTTTTEATTTTVATTTTTASPASAMAALAAAVAAAAVAVAVGVAASVGSAASAAAVQASNQANQIQEQIAKFLSRGGGGRGEGGSMDQGGTMNDAGRIIGGAAGFFVAPTPRNDLAIPVTGDDESDDGCGDSSVRFTDGICYPVLKRGPCRRPHFWVTVDPMTLTGKCSPRLCGKDRVFIGDDGLCHDSEIPLSCRGGRQPFYSAYGDPICDCPIGQYPFPGVKDDCVTLFTQGPCPLGQVVAFSRTGSIRCTPSKCQFNANLPLAPYKDGFCYVLGSKGPCRSKKSLQLFGYDVFRRKSLCLNVTALDLPYFLSDQEEATIDKIYNQLLPEYDNYRIFFMSDPKKGAKTTNLNANSIRKQGGNTAGLFQLPSRIPNSLLNSCRPGARNGNNYKCTNPLVIRGRKLNNLQAVRSPFECPNSLILQATGQCGNETKTASCGPSYQYIEAIGQCRQRI